MPDRDWNMNLCSLVCFGRGLLCAVCGGSREGTDVCVRETRFLQLPPTLAACSPCKYPEFWEGDGGGVLALKILGG